MSRAAQSFAWIALASMVVVAASSVAGCTSPERTAENAPLPSPFTPDAQGTERAGATVYIVARAEITRVVVDVFARGASNVHGLVFRLLWDSPALTFVSASGSPSWSKTAVTLAKPGAAGEVAVVWTERGELTAVDATAETWLGAVVFDASGPIDTHFAFRTARSTIVDRKGNTIDVQWRGGRLDVAPAISSRGVAAH